MGLWVHGGARRLVGAIAVVLSCGDGSDTGSPNNDETAQDEVSEPCDPLASVATPFAPEGEYTVARDVDGTLYVVQMGGSGPEDHRLFVSDDTSLVELEIDGVGEIQSSDGLLTVLLFVENADGVEPFTLVIESRGDSVDVALVPNAEFEGRLSELTDDARRLDVQTQDVLEELSVRALATNAEVEYNATLDDGTGLIVLREGNAIRVFYRDSTVFEEAELVGFSRAQDGGTTTIRFQHAGTLFEVTFPFGEMGLAVVGGEEREVTSLTRNVDDDAATFRCRATPRGRIEGRDGGSLEGA